MVRTCIYPIYVWYKSQINLNTYFRSLTLPSDIILTKILGCPALLSQQLTGKGMRVTQKIMVAAVMAAFCSAVGATSAIPAHAQTVGEIPAEGILVQSNGTHITIDWQDAAHATRYLVQIYTGTILADSLFVTDSILADKELRPGLLYTITATPYADSRAGVPMELAVTRVDDVSLAPTPDVTDPVITLSGPSAVSLVEGATYTEQGATCADARDGYLAVTTSGNVDVNTVGTYTVTYTCTDSAGNEATATRTVVVTDRDSPTIVIRGPASVAVPQGSTYVDQGAACSDSADPNPSLSVDNPVDTNVLGTYSVTYTCVDSDGNTVTANRVVTVTAPDTTPPTITLNGASSVPVVQGGSYAELGATCVDDTDPSPTLRISGTVDANAAGSYPIVYTCTDASGNAATAFRTVTVTAPPAPPTSTPTDTARLVTVVENLASIIESLVQKITALEAKITQLEGRQAVAPFADSGDFVPFYYGAADPYNLAQKSYYENQAFLEGFTERLTQTLALPYDVYLTMDECGEPDALYYPDYKEIVICYEFVTLLEDVLDPYYDTDAELFQAVDHFVTWVTLHELGHALVDVYDLPITGNEEDAVDQFATIIALEYIQPHQSGSDLFPTLLAWYSGGQSNIFPTEGQLAGPHSLASQRFYNIACWMYGSDVHAYSFLVDRDILLEERARLCQSEYERMSESWYRLVSPFLINPGSVQPP